jgi:two-component system CheB/CheR fusion protein
MPNDTSSWITHAIDTSRDHAVMLLDPGGRIVDWRGASENVLGYTAAEAVGQPFSIIFTPEDRDAALDRQELDVARANGRSEDDRWHLRKGGIRFWSSGVLQALRDAGGTLYGFCKILRDRTDHRTQHETLQHRIDTLAGDLERRRRFMLKLGHELRNPLAPIRATVYTIQRLNDPRLQRACEVLDRQVEVMVRLLDDLSEATRADARVGRVLPQPVVVQEAVRTAAVAMQAALDAKRQKLSVVLPDVPLTLEADPARLQQMLLNLLGNAVKYTPPEGHVAMSATIEGDMVAIHVEDDGPGISEDLLPHLFELLARGAKEAEFHEGLGVGLAVVKELATLHGGTVAVRSGAERGSVFTLRLPLAQPAPEQDDLLT